MDGSSPRLWGTPPHVGKAPGAGRFIPTPVGNTCPWARCGAVPAVHPHACGEHRAQDGDLDNAVGSSPRLWGTQGGKGPDVDRGRFIPTPVGNTFPGRGGLRHVPVHPHACGEHVAAAVLEGHGAGSSPRLWGTLVGEHPDNPGNRFIPTPVGNTNSLAPVSRPAPVHPHACGEHSICSPPLHFNCGSSPRLWGTLLPLRHGPFQFRFIPTPVGNTRQPH